VIDANLAGTALNVAGEDADRALWDVIRARLAKTDDAELRSRLLWALVSAKRPELVAEVRELTFDPMLHATEVTAPLWSQLGDPVLRDSAWQWVKDHFDKLLAVVPKHHGQTQLIAMGGSFCDEAHAKDVEAFFTPARLARIDGGPRVLASTLENVRLCAVKRAKQEPSAREMFGKRK
jgi:alanyl aminopeptidase